MQKKIFTAYTPKFDAKAEEFPILTNEYEEKDLVITHEGRPYVLATYESGYTSKRSQTLFARLSVTPPNAAPSCVCSKTFRGDDAGAAIGLARMVFESAEKAHPSRNFTLYQIAAFFGYEDARIL